VNVQSISSGCFLGKLKVYMYWSHRKNVHFPQKETQKPCLKRILYFKPIVQTHSLQVNFLKHTEVLLLITQSSQCKS
jgi:hypothetical protein